MKTGIKRYLILSLAVLGFITVLIFLDESSVAADNSNSYLPAPSLPIVAYQPISISTQNLSIPVYGELKPKWDVQIKSQVNGEVEELLPTIEVGTRVQRKEALAKIDPSRYQVQLDQARLFLEQARLELIQAENKSKLAYSDWTRSGLSKPPTDLMLFKPQLAIAEQNLQSATSQFSLANKTLADTTISAPFDGVIVERYISKGQVVTEGESLFRLVDDQFLTLEVALGEQQWANLAKDWREQIVFLYSTNQRILGKAKLARGGDILDSASRQYSLYLDVTPNLRGQARGGQFVKLELPGRTITGVLNLPESALSQDGTIWLINDDNTLFEYTPEFYFRQADRVLVAPPLGSQLLEAEHPQTWRIAIRPLAFFLSGKSVSPIIERPLERASLANELLADKLVSNTSLANKGLANKPLSHNSSFNK